MFESGDLRQLAELGISTAEAERQLHLFAHPPRSIDIDRPCRLGDGIRALDDPEVAEARRHHDAACRRGRLSKFVPASGAASRMFQSLLAVRNAPEPIDRQAALARAARGDRDAAELLVFLDGLPRFAFYDDLRAAATRMRFDLAELAARGAAREILDVLLSPQGLDYASLPKGLLKFHRAATETRTAFEEHLVEAASYVRDAAGRCRVHLTVSPEHRDRFRALLEAVRPAYERRFDAELAVTFSEQKPSTDTLAVDLDNQPWRTGDGRLLLRPGGHGALIENLNDLGADIVQLQNIDNIAPDHLRPQTVFWKEVLSGHLLAVQEVVYRHLTALHAAPDDGAVLGEALGFAENALGLSLAETGAARRDLLVARLDRPLRVVGVVRNTGEPGGGPFWVRGADGRITLQIVESAQVDRESPQQRARFETATHFNPVNMVCAVRDWRGQPFDLRRFVDPDAVFIARKSKDGRQLKALERPGLWNGGMAEWNTIFVEIPLVNFTPVKTVNDLLRPEHQPG